MHQQAASAYQQISKQTINPRDLEANLLSRSAANLQRIRENWEDYRHELPEALKFNGKLWNVFLASVTGPDSPLPQPIRQNIANLGIFVLSQTARIQDGPDAKKLDVLININRELAAGLRAAPKVAA